MNSLMITSIEQGLIFSILAMGVYISYKILDFADLSVEGTFPFGAFVFARFITLGANPVISTASAFISGTAAGLLTAVLFTKLRIKPLLSGILTMTILYSINLRVNGKSNIPLFKYSSIYDISSAMLVLLIIVVFIKLALDIFLKTETGYLLIVTGDNESLVKSLGQDNNKYKLLGLMISNGLVALSGALMAQYQGFADITMGSSIIVIALASIIIGDTIKKNSRIINGTSSAILGALFYKIIGGIAIDLGLNPNDLKAINAMIVIVFISYNNFSSEIKSLFNVKGAKSIAKNKNAIEEF